MDRRSRKGGAGAPGAVPGDRVWPHVCGRYRSCVLEYRAALAACRRRLSRNAVHDLRVAIRRLLACVELMRAAGRREPPVRRPLRRQLAALGALRDTQVQLRMVRRGALGERDAQPVVAHLRKLRKRRARKAAAELALDAAAGRLGGFDPGPAPGGGRAVMRLREFLERRLRRAAASLAALSSDSRLGPPARHRARVRLRKLHLILDALGPVWHGDRDGRLSRSLSACQGLIGQIHDQELLQRRIGRLASLGKLPDDVARTLNERVEVEKAGRLKACLPLIRRARVRSSACA